MFVQSRTGKNVWAFGVEPAKVKYRLRLARYPALAEYLGQWLQDRADTDKLTLVDIGVGFGRTFFYVEAQGLADDFDEVGVRGFRIISGGVLRWLENHFWWYRFKRWLGSVLPRLCIEIQLLMVPKA